MKSKVISLEEIEFQPDNPRLTFADESMDELVASLKRDGLIQPILVRPKGAKYELVVGERRVRAAVRANIPKLPAIIREDITDEEASRLRMIENINRRDLNVFEKVNGIKTHMEKYGTTFEEMAKALQKKVVTLQDWFAVTRTTSPKIKVRDHFVRQVGIMNLRLLAKYNDETQERLAEKIFEKNLSQEKVKRFLKLFDSNPDADLELLSQKAEEQMKTIEVTLPAEEAKEVLRKAEEIRKKEKKAKKKLERHLRKPRRKKAKAKEEKEEKRVEIPYETPAIKKLWDSTLAKEIQKAGLTAREVELLKKFERQVQIAQMRPEEFGAKAHELVERVISETRPQIVVLEVPPKLYKAIEAFANSERIFVKDAVLVLLEECLERRGFWEREAIP